MSDFEEGSEIAGRFVLRERVGQGGMGAVYRALQRSLDREVALKVLHSQVAFTARARRRFAREARAVARLNHPHIAGVYDFGVDEDGQTLWLAMEFVRGHSMTALKRQDIDYLRILSLTDQILSALSAAHARGIIHRDLKPSNVLVTKDVEGHEVIKLVDFGLASTQDGEVSLENAPLGLGEEASEPANRAILGTPRYMAPEIFRRQPLDLRVDLYALGVLLYELIAGIPPFPGEDPRVVMRGHLHETVPQLEARDGRDVPSEFERCIEVMLAKDPAERFQSAAEAREHIQAVINQFSYVPWMVMGPPAHGAGGAAAANTSGSGAAGFFGGFGGQTRPPAAMLPQQGSHFGPLGVQTPPLVGRVTERRLVESLLRGAISQHSGGVIFVEGEPGIGKTRLMQWIEIRVQESGLMRALYAPFSSARSGLGPFRAAAEMVLETHDFHYEEIPYIVENKLRKWGFGKEDVDACIRFMRPGGDAMLSETKVSREVPSSPFASLFTAENSGVKQEQLFATLERIFRRTCSQKPLLLLLDDVQHADDPALSFIEHMGLGMHLASVPLVLLCGYSARDAKEPSRLRQVVQRLQDLQVTEIQHIALSRLDTSEATSLVQKIVPIDQELAGQIAEFGAGNPLHLTQLVRYLQESGKLSRNGNRWMLREGVSLADEIPHELAEMMRYRIEQTSRQASNRQAARDLLSRAAVLGVKFDYKLLRIFLSREANRELENQVDRLLEDFIQQGVLREVGHSGEDLLEFDHILLREVLLQDLQGRRLPMMLNRLAAEAKIDFHGDRVNTRALEIAEHYRRARILRGVYKFTLRAAHNALASSDLKGAMSLYREAEDLVPALDREASMIPSDPSAEAPDSVEMEYDHLQETSSVLDQEELVLQVAHLERRLGEYDAAQKDYRRLLRSANRQVGLWSQWGLGELAQRLGDYSEALDWFGAARQEIAGLHDDKKSLAREERDVDAFCALGLGTVAYLQGDLDRARQILEQTLDAAHCLQRDALEIEACRLLSEIAWWQNQRQKAEDARCRASILAEQSGDSEVRALSQLHSAFMLRMAGRLDDAAKKARLAAKQFDTLGKRHSLAHCLMMLGETASLQRETKEAAEHLKRAHRIFEVYRDRRGMADAKFRLASLAADIGRFGDAVGLVREARKSYHGMCDMRGEALSHLLEVRVEVEDAQMSSSSPPIQEAGVAHIAEQLRKCGDAYHAHIADWVGLAAVELGGPNGNAGATFESLWTTLQDTPIYDSSLVWALESLGGRLKVHKPEFVDAFQIHLQRTRQGLRPA